MAGYWVDCRYHPQHRRSRFRQAIVKQIATIGVGDNGIDERTSGIVQFDDNPRNARFAGILITVAVLVNPDVIADCAEWFYFGADGVAVVGRQDRFRCRLRMRH